MTDTITLDEYYADKRSDIERLFDCHWQQYKPAGVPDPECEVTGLVPGRRFRVDRFFRGARLVVELDGGQWKAGGGRHNSDRDREKINLLTLQGHRVLRYSRSMIEADPQGVVREVAGAILQLKDKR